MKLRRTPRREGREVAVSSGAAVAHAHVDGSATTATMNTSMWTAGQRFWNAAGSVAIVGILALGVLGGVHAVLPQASTFAPPAEVQAGLTIDQQRSGAYAVDYVSAWLAATSSEPGRLSDFVDVSALAGLGQTPSAARDLQVAAIDSVDVDVVRVLVTGLVDEPGADGEGITVPRAFEVVVSIDEGGSLAPVGLPAPVALPASAETPSTGYSEVVVTESGPAQAVRDFLNAYLAGAGDLTRYVTPGVTLAPITPAPYASVELVSIDAASTIPDSLADGDELEVLAQVRLVTADGEPTLATYTFTLTARADRWEVSALNPTPVLTADGR